MTKILFTWILGENHPGRDGELAGVFKSIFLGVGVFVDSVYWIATHSLAMTMVFKTIFLGMGVFVDSVYWIATHSPAMTKVFKSVGLYPRLHRGPK